MKKLIYTIAIICSTGTLFAQNNLGVDQTNPQAKVHVTNTTNQKSLLIEDEANDATPFVIDSVGNVGVQTATPSVGLDVNTTDAIGMPNGTTVQRPAVANAGDMRFNSDTKGMEFYDGTVWVSLTPSGTMQPFGGHVAFVPNGWLICDGSAVSRNTYATLFAIIGTNYGVGDGVTTFNLPDLRGQFLRGADNGAGNDPDATSRIATNGGNNGDAVGSVQNDEFASHRHDINAVAGTISTSGYGLERGFDSSTNVTLGSAVGSWPIVNAGGSSETRPKNVNVNYIIKY